MTGRTEERRTNENHTSHGPGHRGHGWMMMACCIPMLAIAVALVATGVVGAGFLVTAVACTAMMALMMRGMNHGERTGGQADKPALRPLPPAEVTVGEQQRSPSALPGSASGPGSGRRSQSARR